MKFTVVAYDKDTYESISDAMHGDGDVFTITAIQAETTWREIQLIERTLRKTLSFMGCATAVGLAVINGMDTTTFPFDTLCPAQGVVRERHPMQEAEQIYEQLTTTDVRLSNDDILQLMKLLPLGNSSHSGVREKLHQGSIAINKKR